MGVFVFFMCDDRYVAFKKWLNSSDYYFQKKGMEDCFSSNIVFKIFEHEYDEKEKDDMVKKLIVENIPSSIDFVDAEKLINVLKKEKVLK